ncbi:hypothetical protein CDEST_04181 [Colletotrichum destructivum]|uniref:Uncharacterized protein n=1 Tax=Colletotrichum destructivum TaxID=34406 RepID=A0AAX4I712_9PEZI|nr:hypothetical protein CDEST_04181 [Colletotrichum destructivum]
MAASQDPFLGCYLPLAVRQSILSQFWEACQPDLSQMPNMQPYFEYHSARCRQFLHNGGIHVTAKKHSELIGVSKRILGEVPKETLVASITKERTGSERPDPERVGNTLALCASLLLMTNVRGHRYGVSGSNLLDWTADETLKGSVESHFARQRPVLQSGNTRLSRLFTARNLSRVGGMNVKWTTNLVDHLILADDDRTVFLFHCASFLKFQKSCARGIFPEGLMEETIRTLTLLFPENDIHSRKWLKTEIDTKKLDRSLASCGSLRSRDRRFEKFFFWHDRLLILKQAFDESSPRTLAQWWNDRRNIVQWYTFWVAIMVFVLTTFFGLVQSIEGGLQVWLAWEGRGSK